MPSCSLPTHLERKILYRRMCGKRILESVNKPFNLLDHRFGTLMNTQTALTEGSVAAEEQVSDHEVRIQALELSLTDMKKIKKQTITL